MKKSLTTDPIQRELVTYSEDNLQRKVVEPLLRAMNFKDVRDRSGVNERGKDLTAIKEEDFGESYYAIQLKKTKLSGKVSSTDSLAFVVNQLRQAIQEEIVFPSEMEPRKPNRLIFITPFPMETSAVSSLERAIVDVKSQGVTIVDGIQLADLVRKFLPEFLTGEETYRKNIFIEADSLREANIALQTNRNISVQDIYVDISVADKKNVLGELTNKELYLTPSEKVGAMSARDFEIFSAIQQLALGFSFEDMKLKDLKRDRKDLIDTGLIYPRNKKDVDDYEDFAITSPNRAFSKLVEKATLSKKALMSFGASSMDRDSVRKAFNYLRDINHFASLALKTPFLKGLWLDTIGRHSSKAFRVNAETLLMSSTPISIVGHAGAGKTTLLKHMTQLAAQNELCEIPIFVPLLNLPNYSKKGIVEFAINSLQEGGFVSSSRKTESNGLKLLKSGGLRLHFDGLDETGIHVKKAITAIKEFNVAYPSVPIVLTSRHTITIDWDELVRFSIEPFSKAKLTEFISKWFDAEPTALAELSHWIESHKSLESVTQSPLIAALLCVLYSAEVELPDTEEELYSRRLELLLGQWDSAKGIAKMPRKRREAYLLFLKTLAFHMHSEGVREIPYQSAVEWSRKFFVEFRDSKQSMVIDCISRGLLFRNGRGEVSFGHLTYQEHLAAMYLSKHNPVIDILNYLEAPWWSKVLEYYSMQMGSIDQLIRQANKYKKMSNEKLLRLSDLAENAPYTSETVRYN